MVTEEIILDLLLGHLNDLPAQSPAVEIALPGIDYSPTIGTTYLQADILPAENRNIGIKQTTTTEFRGIFQVTVVAPIKKGLIAATRTANAVVDHFERDEDISGNGIIIRRDTRPSIGPYLQEADRLRVPVRIRYYALV